MFTGFKRGNLSSYSKYKVGVTTTSIEESSLLNGGGLVARLKTVGKTTTAAITVLMMLMVMFVGLITSAPSANANVMEDMKQDMMCQNGASGFRPTNKISMISATTGDGFSSNPTAFEKYGFAGNNFSSWIGFSTKDPSTFGFGSKDSITANDNYGIESSAGIIRMAGKDAADSGMNDWSNDLRKNEKSGLWNHEQQCAYFGLAYSFDYVADIFITMGEFNMGVTNFVYELASNGEYSLMNVFKKPIDKIVTTLKNKMFFEYLIPVIMIMALWVAHVGLVKRQAARATGIIIWAIACIAGSVALMSSPTALPVTATKVTSGISAGILSAATVPDDGNDLCKVEKSKNKSNDALRQFQCNQWYTFSYTPWVQGQFGKTPSELVKDKKFSKLIGSDIAYQDDKMTLKTLKVNGSSTKFEQVKLGNRIPASQSLALSMLDYKSNWDNADAWQRDNKTRGAMNIAAVELGGSNYNEDFAGDHVGTRVSVAFTAMIGAVASSLLIVTLAFSILWAELLIIFLSLFLPFIALIAISGTWGMRVARNYGQLMLHAAIQRILLTGYMAIFIAMIQYVATDRSTVGWFLTTILILLVTGAGFAFRKPVMGLLKTGDAGESFMQPAKDAINRSRNNAMNMAGMQSFGTGNGGGALAKLASKGSTARKIASMGNKAGGAGKSPQEKPQVWTKDQKENPLSKNRQTETDNPDATNEKPLDNSGAGEAPQEQYDSAQHNETPDTETPEFSWNNNRSDDEAITDNSGTGEAPQQGTQAEDKEEAPAVPMTRKQQKAVQKAEYRATTKRIAQELKANGYRTRVGAGTVLAGAVKGLAVGALTGSVRAGFQASSSTVARKKYTIQQRNAEIVKNVSQNERDRSYQLARQQRQSEFEKAQSQRKAEREANQKRFAEERAKRNGSSNQQGRNPQGQNPQQKPDASRPAPKTAPQPVVRESAGREPQQQVETETVTSFSASAPQQVRESSTPYVETPRVETPRTEAQRVEAPRPTNTVREVRTDTSRSNQPASQPVREPAKPMVEKLPPAAPKPQQNREVRVEAPKQDTPRYNPPVSKPVREAPAVSKPANTPAPKTVSQPRSTTPAPKPVVKESKPKVSNPQPPAPPKPKVSKAKVNPPKAVAPQPPLPSRRSLRDSGKTNPPAPKPPQSRK